jgi:hypothetical protein
MPLFTIIPTVNDPDAAHASAILRHIVSEPLNVVYVLLGRPAAVEQILQTALGRAEAFPQTRRVVHVPEPGVLEPAHLAEIMGGKANTVAVVYGLRDTAKKRLTAQRALDPLSVELAFTAPEA